MLASYSIKNHAASGSAFLMEIYFDNFFNFCFAAFTNSFLFSIPCSEIIPVMFFNFVLSKGWFSTSIYLLLSSQTSLPERFFIVIFFVNFSETPQEYVGTPWILESSDNVEVPNLFATSDFVKASAPKKNMSHFFKACSEARSGTTIVFIFAEARSFAVLWP